MGYHHLLRISNDALQLNKERRAEVESAVGKGVFTLCVDPQLGHLRGPQLERATSADILNAGSALSYEGEFHHTEPEVLVWTGAGIKRLNQLTPSEVAEVLSKVRAITK